MEAGEPHPREDGRMRAADSMSIDRMFKAVKASKELVFDIETTGVDWKRHFAVGYVITVGLRPEDTYYVPVRHGGGRNISKGHTPDGPEDVGPRVLPFEKRFNAEIASRTDLLVVGHHLKFDLHMAARSEEHTSELQSQSNLVCRLLLEKKKRNN